jgi:hypothetical protein
MINYGKYFGMSLLLSVALLAFVSATVVSVPSLRYSIGNFLLSYQDLPLRAQPLTADVINSVTKSVDPNPLPAPTINTSDDYSALSKPKTYEYKLLKSVDICQMNTLGADGFQAIDYGGNMDISSGRDADCKNYHTVNVLDWVLFMKEK